jgi:hypothetical protein
LVATKLAKSSSIDILMRSVDDHKKVDGLGVVGYV